MKNENTDNAAEAKLAMIQEKAESALQTSWLYSGKEHVEKLMREIADISSENAGLSRGDESEHTETHQP
jgi:hypothetical protein